MVMNASTSLMCDVYKGDGEVGLVRYLYNGSKAFLLLNNISFRSCVKMEHAS